MNPNLIRKELAKLRTQLIIQGINPNEALNQARKAMNDKYGHSWRSEPYTSKQSCGPISPSIYDDHTHGQHWMD